MRRAILLGALYFAGIFALGFVFGTLRELVFAPLVGRGIVVLIEAPLILLAAWFLCRWLLSRFAPLDGVGQHLLMGMIAFFLLLVGEAAVAVGLMAASLASHFAGYTTISGMLELLPQMAFGLFPALQFLRRGT